MRKIKQCDRHEWVSTAAYYKAEARGFEKGYELINWLEAEKEFAEYLIQQFWRECHEDGGMTLSELKNLAYSLAVERPDIYETIKGLIRAIQKASHRRSCFQTEYRHFCEDETCQWRHECRKLVAVWHR